MKMLVKKIIIPVINFFWRQLEMGIDPTGEESQFYGLSFEQVVASMC